jgi:hypothetical protein
MYKLQLCLVQVETATNQQPLPPPIPLNPFIMQQLLESQANTMPWRVDSTPIQYQGMAQENQHQHPSQYQQSSGPSRHQRRNKGFRKAEPQYRNHIKHESSGTITGDRSTGNPGHARIGASDDTGVGKVWRIPSRNPFMVDHNSNPADVDDEAIRQGSSEPDT